MMAIGSLIQDNIDGRVLVVWWTEPEESRYPLFT